MTTTRKRRTTRRGKSKARELRHELEAAKPCHHRPRAPLQGSEMYPHFGPPL